MKILFYNHTGRVSGAERVLLMILEKIERERFDPVVLCPSDGSLAGMITALGVRTVAINSLTARFTWRPDRLIRYFASFARMIREARAAVVSETPDVIHANSIRAGLVISAATVGLRLPVVWHAHDLLPSHALSSGIRLFACASKRNRVVAVSRAVAARFRGLLLRLFPRRVPMAVIHNAVDLENFQPDPASREEKRYALGFTEKHLLVGIVGQLTPRKAQLELIEAFAAAVQRIPSAVLLIVGEAIFNRDFEYAEWLRQKAIAWGISDRVHFLGQREDVAALMRAFDVLVVNSRAEPFGLTVVEAMASGTTVLATAVDGINEIVEHDRTGYLVNSGDRYGLVEALCRLLVDTDLRNRLADAALSDVSARFASNRFLRDLTALYQRAFESGRNPCGETAHSLAVKLSAD